MRPTRRHLMFHLRVANRDTNSTDFPIFPGRTPAWERVWCGPSRDHCVDRGWRARGPSLVGFPPVLRPHSRLLAWKRDGLVSLGGGYLFFSTYFCNASLGSSSGIHKTSTRVPESGVSIRRMIHSVSFIQVLYYTAHTALTYLLDWNTIVVTAIQG